MPRKVEHILLPLISSLLLISTSQSFPDDGNPTIEICEILNGRANVVGDYSQETDPDRAMRLFIDTRETWNGKALVTAHYDKQRVKVTVQIEPLNIAAAKAHVRWELRDPDDPAMHSDLDPNDGGNPKGSTAMGGDNSGADHEGDSHWFTIADHPHYDRTDQKSSATGNQGTIIGELTTRITRDKVRLVSTAFFNFSDDGGDNFIIKAVLVDNKGTEPKADDRDADSDNSETLTVWRKRFVRVFGMTRNTDDAQTISPGNGKTKEVCLTAGPDGKIDSNPTGDDEKVGETITSGLDGIRQTPTSGDDIDLFAIGCGKPNQTCVSEGLDNILDTTTLGDDAVMGKRINTGANGICETNALMFCPSHVGSIEDVTSYLRSAYSNVADANRATYCDFDVSSGGSALKYQPDIRLANGSMAQYLQDTIHANVDTHLDNTYDLVGARQVSIGENNANNFPGTSAHRPHILLNVGLLRTWTGMNSLNGVATHELAHALADLGSVALHRGHSEAAGGGFDVCAGSTHGAAAAKPGHFCPKHVRLIRNKATRSWGNHNETSTVQESTAFDSN